MLTNLHLSKIRTQRQYILEGISKHGLLSVPKRSNLRSVSNYFKILSRTSGKPVSFTSEEYILR